MCQPNERGGVDISGFSPGREREPMLDRHMFRRSAPIFIKTELFPGLNEGSYFAGLSGLAAMKLHTPVVNPG
jgi:hypothetical protein